MGLSHADREVAIFFLEIVNLVTYFFVGDNVAGTVELGCDHVYLIPKMHAVRVHDELLSNRGIALVRMVSYAVDRVARPVTPPDTSAVKGLGDEPVSLVVITDDDRESELATSREHTDIASGPFDTVETGLGQ